MEAQIELKIRAWWLVVSSTQVTNTFEEFRTTTRANKIQLEKWNKKTIRKIKANWAWWGHEIVLNRKIIAIGKVIVIIEIAIELARQIKWTQAIKDTRARVTVARIWFDLRKQKSNQKQFKIWKSFIRKIRVHAKTKIRNKLIQKWDHIRKDWIV